MSDVEESVNGTSEDGGVLTNLPRARPQRASARRIAERNSASAGNGTRKTAVERSPRKLARASTEAAAKPAPSATKAGSSAKTRSEPSMRTLAKGSVKSVGESAAASTAKASRGERAGARRPGRRAQAPRRAAAKRERAAPVEEPAPRQGFECEGETPAGSVQPPGGAELVASAAELVGELAKAGIATGERLLKDVRSRLPL